MKITKKLSTLHSQLSNPKGFTLIELLVVVAIIGILASFLMVNFIGVRQRGRDAQRKSDLKQMQSALELYRSDNSVYPLTMSACGSAFSGGSVTYMQKIPCDPLPDPYPRYTYVSDTVTFSIIACLENTSDPQKDPTNDAPCNDTTNKSLTVRNP